MDQSTMIIPPKEDKIDTELLPAPKVEDHHSEIVLSPKYRDNHQFTVKGYDASFPEEVIKRDIIKHFSACGKIFRVHVLGHCSGPHAKTQAALMKGFPPGYFDYLYIRGEDPAEKAVKLNGRCLCDVKGCKIVVDKVLQSGLDPIRKPLNRGSSKLPARL